MAKTLSATVGRWVTKSKRRTDAIIKTSAFRVGEIAQTPIAKGGNLPVDTSFLRQTFTAEIGKMPEGPGQSSDGLPGDWEGSVTLTINGMKSGDVLFMGWSAVYARKMEERYGFMKGGALQWKRIVAEATREARARIR